MKFICTQENLNRGISMVSHLTNRSVGLPILNNILLEVSGGNLVLNVTNLEIGVTTEIRGKAETEGKFTIDTKVLADYVAILPKSNVEIELVKNQLSITCENFHTLIRGQAADEFPIIPQLQENGGFSVNAQKFKDALQQTTFATSFDEMRSEINGVFFQVNNKQLIIAATDSYRLAEKKLSLEKVGVEKEVIIPLKTLQEIERMISLIEEEVIECFFDENQIKFKLKPTIVVSRLIEGNFPNYREIIPSSFSTRVILDRERFVQAIRAASLFTRSGIKDVSITFVPVNKTVVIKTANTQLGEQKTVLEGDVAGEELTIIFNYKYLLDGLQSISDDRVLLEMNSSATPVILRSEKDRNYLYLVMPIKQ